MKDFFEIVMYIFFFVLVMVGAYYASRWVSTKSISLYRGKNINIIERVPIDKDKSFVLLRRGDKVYLIGVANNNMTIIDNFDYQEFSTEEKNFEDTDAPSKIFNFPLIKSNRTDEKTDKNIITFISDKVIAIINKIIGFFKKRETQLPTDNMDNNDGVFPEINGNSHESDDFIYDKEMDDVFKRMYIRKQHLKEQGELLKRGGK